MVEKNNYLLFAGALLTLFGFGFKLNGSSPYLSLFFFISGGICKFIYIVSGFRSGNLAGWNFVGLLVFGLMLLYFSIFLRKETSYNVLSNIVLLTAIYIKVSSIIGMKQTGLARKKIIDACIGPKK